MRPQKVLDTEILEGLAQVFRSKGYEGSSLKDLAEATGLKKASLYHRFPRGKQEMAEAVFKNIGKWVEENVFTELTDTRNSPETRLKNGLSQIRTLYKGGDHVCLLRALSLQTGLGLFTEQIRNGIQEWLAAFKEIGMAFQLSLKDAEENSLQTLIDIQGCLIITKCLGDLTIFEKTLQRIENRYLTK